MKILRYRFLNLRNSIHLNFRTDLSFFTECKSSALVVLMYTQKDFDSNLECVVVNFESADGNIKLVNVQARLIKWVQNISVFFTDVLSV